MLAHTIELQSALNFQSYSPLIGCVTRPLTPAHTPYIAENHEFLETVSVIKSTLAAPSKPWLILFAPALFRSSWNSLSNVNFVVVLARAPVILLRAPLTPPTTIKQMIENSMHAYFVHIPMVPAKNCCPPKARPWKNSPGPNTAPYKLILMTCNKLTN